MKYEMIFGDEALFDGAPDGAEYAGWFCQETRWYMILNGKILFSDGGTWCTSDNPYLSADIAAMRRIIAEPKHWTVEDQKAGRLPEVGSIGLTDYGRAEYLGNDVISVNKCHVRYEADGYCERIAIKKFTPIESPEEKAQRLRSEWLNKAYVDFHRLGCELEVLQKEQIKQIYDAILSGDLPVPVKE